MRWPDIYLLVVEGGNMNIASRKSICIAAFAAMLLVVLDIYSASANAAQLQTMLRTDLSQIYNATNYRVKLKANALSSGSVEPNGTSMWLGVNLAQFTGPVFSGQFSQVGLQTTNPWN
jgi:hypothetical protein